MKLEAFDWNVVIAGYWNRAILTPAGIGRRLFNLEEGTPVLVEVPMDGLAPPRVKNEGLTIIAEMGRLFIGADDSKYASLDRARAIAVNAIESLPETPLTAAGFNIRFRVDEPSDKLLAITSCGADTLLSDSAFVIEERTLKRALNWKDGILNLSINQGQSVRIELNFHRQSSKKEDLTTWLKYSIDDVKETVKIILEKVIEIPSGEIGND